MRIAIVSDYFLDYVGGAQTSMVQQRSALIGHGHQVFMVSPARGRGPRYRVGHDHLFVTPLFTVPAQELPIIPNNARVRARLERYFREHAIEVVHVQTEFGLAHAAADVARRLGIPVVHTVHTFYWASEGSWHAPLAGPLTTFVRRMTGSELPMEPLSSRAVDNLLRNATLAMAKAADVVVSPSSHQAADLRAAGVTAPIHVIPNPVATQERPPVPLTREDATEPSILWVARCEAVKRPLVFAEAAIIALDRGARFTVDFVGDGSELEALRRLVAGRSEIRVHGALGHDEVLEVMDRSAAVALTSVGFDNQPMTIAEAVSRRRGVLYCDPKLTEGLGNAGYLAASADAEGLADALVALAADPSILLALSEGAAGDHALFSPERYVAGILAAYAGS